MLDRKVGVSEIAIRKYEANDRKPKLETLFKIASILNVSVQTLAKNEYSFYSSQIEELEPINYDFLRQKKLEQQVIQAAKEMDKAIANNPPQTVVLGKDKLTRPFTRPAKKIQTDEEISSTPDQSYIMSIDVNRHQRYNIIMLKYDSGEELTQEEKDYVMQYWKDNRLAEKLAQLPAKFKELSEILRQNYELLNTEGQEKANEQIKHAAEQIELLTKIPEYQKKNEE